MRKLRSRKIFKIKSSYIAEHDYVFDLTVETARALSAMVSVAENQVFHAIGRITGNTENYNLVDNCYKKVNREKQKEKPNRQYILGLRDQIDNLLFLKEIINVKVDNKTAYRHICKHGFVCNGEKYVRLLCGAGMGRRSTVSFCQERIYSKLDEILRCGLIIDEINVAKYNAYYGLYMSGCYDVRTPRILVVSDCELDITGNKVDFIVDDKKITPYGETIDYRKIEERDYVFHANVFDGAGLISPSMAKQWAKDLDINYIPSNFVIRSAFIKGMVSVFDFYDFAKRYCEPDETGKYKVKDCYGNQYYIDDIDVILTTSQFKMWKRYNSIEEYLGYVKLYGHVWGVSKFSPQIDKEYSLINYQYIQTLNLNDEDINDLISYTENWLNKIRFGNELYLKLFFYGVGNNNNTINDIMDKANLPFAKALCLDFDLYNDDYIRKKIINLSQKKIDEAKIGRLWVRGNYQTMIPDPFALAQHVFGLKVTGLLQKDNHYSYFWVTRKVNQINCMRSPMVDASEHKISNIVCTKEMRYWYKYLESGIVMNIWGLDTITHSDSDFDGDAVYSTDNKTMIESVYSNMLPITYDKESAPPQKLNIQSLITTDLKTFDCKIGQTTNFSTKFFSMLCNFQNDSAEYKELVNRIKLLRRYIGDAIDAGKGVATKPFPSEWKSWRRVPEDWSEKQKGEQWFLNNLVEKRKPYFFVYIYPKTMDEYKQYKSKMNVTCRKIFGVNFNLLKSKNEKTQEEKNFIRTYYDKMPVTKTPCIMNKIAWKFENLDYDSKSFRNSEKENLEIAKKLMCGDYKFSKVKMEKLKQLCNEWKKRIIEKHQRQDILFSEPVSVVEEIYDENFSSINDFLEEEFRRKIEQIFPNDKEAADYLIKMAYIDNKRDSKDFCWIFGGEQIVKNMLGKIRNVRIPIEASKGEMGSDEYLGKYYKLHDVRVP